MSNPVAEDLFEKIRGRFPSLKLGKESGERTLRPQEAAFYEFDFQHEGKKYGSVVVSIVDEGYLKVYFSSSMLEEADTDTQDAWYGFLKELSKFSTRNMLNYETKNISKARLDKKDYIFLRDRYKSEDELTMESKLYGSRQKSYQDLSSARIIVQHNRSVDEERKGSRSRDIRAIYIENSEGERFKFVNNYLPGARAMARHVASGGYPNDERGQHIVEIMQEMSELRNFVNKVNTSKYVNEDAQAIIEAASSRYYGLRDTLRSVTGQRGYSDYFENWEPNAIEVNENDIEDLKQRLTRTVFDDRLEGSLGAVGKAMKLSEKKQGEFFDYRKWLKAAKSAGAEVRGDVSSSVAILKGQEIGSWEQTEDDLTAPKTGSDVQEPGYGEIGMGDVDRGEGTTREYTVPGTLDLMPGANILPTMKFSKNDRIGPLTAVLRDIAARARDDETSVFAADMAQTIASVGTAFGQKADDPEFKQNYVKAIELAKKYLAQTKTEAVEAAEYDHTGVNEMDRYESRLTQISEGTWAVPDSMDKVKKLQDLMSQHFPAGEDGENATSALYNIIGDDQLYDMIGEIAEDDPDECVRPVVKQWIEDNVDSLDIDDRVRQALKNMDYGDMTEAAKPDFLDLDDDGDTEEPMKKAARDKKAKTEEGRMSDIDLEVRDMIEAGASDQEIMAKFPGIIGTSDLKRYRSEVMDRPGEYDESIDKLRRMAGIGSNARSNHGLREGEPGYQITPRSIVAREMRKLQDIERG